MCVWGGGVTTLVLEQRGKREENRIHKEEEGEIINTKTY